jgi:hypothetical protein
MRLTLGADAVFNLMREMSNDTMGWIFDGRCGVGGAGADNVDI